MRRLTVSLLVLALLAAAGWANSRYLTGLSGEIIVLLERAGERGAAEDWEGAENLTRQAHARWETSSGYLSLVLRHNETDEVNSRFCEVSALIDGRESPEYAAANGQLISQLEHMSEMEQLRWRNVLCRTMPVARTVRQPILGLDICWD